MKLGLSGCIVAALVMSESALGQGVTYQPLGTWVDPGAKAYSQWTARVYEASERLAPISPGQRRPPLPGLRPRSVELLEGYFLRAHPKLLNSNPERARQLILRRYNSGLGPLRGYMAEAMFVDRNPEWNLVRSGTAPQHDVTRQIAGHRAPFNGQIKYHDSGNAAIYVSDMVKDHRAHRFFIPDDHVSATKAYLRNAALRAQSSGSTLEANRLWRDYGRVRPIGATSGEIRNATREAARSVAREGHALYTSLGAVTALSLVPTLYDVASGHMTANVAAYRLARSASLIGVGIGTDQLLARIGQGALRGGLRGNAIVGSALAVTEITWLLYENGWRRVFYMPEFYEEAGGGISALSLGLIGGTVATTVAAETGPWAPVIGVGASVVTGTVGYFGGKAATRELLELVKPEMLRERERQKIEGVKSGIDASIRDLQARPLGASSAAMTERRPGGTAK